MRYPILILLCAVSQLVFAQTKNGAIRIDGFANDWDDDLKIIDNATGYITAAKNDDQHLYLLFQTDNPQAMNKLLRLGMEVKIKAKTKPKVSATIAFPLEAITSQQNNRQRSGRPSQNQQAQQWSQEERNTALIERIETALESKNQAKLKGFTETNGHMLLRDIQGIDLVLGTEMREDTIMLNYEVKVPLIELFGQEFKWDQILAAKTTLTIQVNGMSVPQGDQRSNSQGSNRRGAGNRGRGSRDGTNRGAQSGRFNQTSMGDQTIKIKYAFTDAKQ